MKAQNIISDIGSLLVAPYSDDICNNLAATFNNNEQEVNLPLTLAALKLRTTSFLIKTSLSLMIQRLLSEKIRITSS